MAYRPQHKTHFPQSYRFSWVNPRTRNLTEIAACGTKTFPDWIYMTDVEEEMTCRRCKVIVRKREERS